MGFLRKFGPAKISHYTVSDISDGRKVFEVSYLGISLGSQQFGTNNGPTHVAS